MQIFFIFCEVANHYEITLEILSHCIIVMVGWVRGVWSVDLPTNINAHKASNKFNVSLNLFWICSCCCCCFVFFSKKYKEKKASNSLKNTFVITPIVRLVATLSNEILFRIRHTETTYTLNFNNPLLRVNKFLWNDKL